MKAMLQSHLNLCIIRSLLKIIAWLLVLLPSIASSIVAQYCPVLLGHCYRIIACLLVVLPSIAFSVAFSDVA